MSKPVILLDNGEFVALPGGADGDVLTWNGTTQAWQSSPGGGVGTVTSVALSTASTGLTVSGGTSQTITGSGTFTLGGTLGAGYGGTGLGAPASGDAGKVLAATAGGGYELVTNGNGTVTSVTAGTGLSGGTITTTGTISMPSVGTAGSYGSASSVPVITTDAQGRVSSVTPTSIAIAQSAVADLVTDLAGKVSTSTQVIAGTGLSGGGALSGNVTLSLPSVGTQGTYGSASSVAVVTTDAQGRVSGATTTAIAITQSQVADLVTDLGNKADKSVTATAGTGLTGGGSLAANFSFALDTVGTAASNQGSASKTVTLSTDAYGRVTSLSEQSIGSLPASAISSGQFALAQGGTGIDASGVTGGQLLVGGSGVLALQNVSGDASLASTGAVTVTKLQGNAVSATTLGLPDAGKALVWSGSAWQATNIQGGGGGGGLTFYMNYAASSPYPLSTQFDEHAGWDTGAITVANDANGTALGTFVTAVGTPAVEVIPAGIWEVNFYAQSSDGVNSTAVRFKVAKLAGATQTVLATSDWVYLSDPSAVVGYTGSVYVPLTDVALTDRIEIIFEGRRFVSAAQTITVHFGNDSITHTHTTINAPGGTGLLKVVNGYLQSPASLLVNADVDATAAIAVAKLAAGTNSYILTTVAGVPTWSAPPATGVTSLAGTADQVLVSGTTGSPQTGALTLTLPQSVASTSSPTFAGLTLSGLTNGIVKATSGVLSGGNSVSLTGDVSGTLGIANGGTGLTASGSSGNLLVSDGSAWASVAMSGDATIASTGALALKNTGTAGTYGSASAVPVFVTDAQGRVSSVTNTNIDISASAITSGTLGVARGGTGLSSFTTGQIIYASATNVLSAGTLSSLNWSGITPAGSVSIIPGSAITARTITLTAGLSSAANGAGGAFTIAAGAAGTGGTGGALTLRAGSGSGSNGALSIGETNTASIAIGATGITTTVAGTLAAVTAAVDTSTTQVATTAYVVNQAYLKSATASSTYAPIASPTFTGTPAAPTPLTADSSTTIATTAFVKAQSYLTTATAASTYAPLASPALTGLPTAPTPVLADSSTNIATTAFVKGQGYVISVSASSPLSSTGGTNPTISLGTVGVDKGGTGATTLTGYVKGSGTAALTASTTIPVADVSGAAPLASPTFTGTVTLPLTTAGYVKTTSGGVISSSASVPTSDLSGSIALGSQVSGTLPIANGGTNNASLSVTQGTVYYGDGSKLVGLAAGSSNQFLQTQGASLPPVWASISQPYDLLGRFAGNPATNAVLYSSPVPRAATVSTTTGNHYFYASALPSAGTSVITVYKTLATNGIKVAMFTATWTAGQAAASNGLYQAVIGTVSANTLSGGDVFSVEMGTTNTSFLNPQFAVYATVG